LTYRRTIEVPCAEILVAMVFSVDRYAKFENLERTSRKPKLNLLCNQYIFLDDNHPQHRETLSTLQGKKGGLAGELAMHLAQ
jgi:hypothetical protein